MRIHFRTQAHTVVHKVWDEGQRCNTNSSKVQPGQWVYWKECRVHGTSKYTTIESLSVSDCKLPYVFMDH